MQRKAILLVHVCAFAALANQPDYNAYPEHEYPSVSFAPVTDDTQLYANKSGKPKYYYPTDTKETRRSNLDPPPQSFRRNHAADEAQMTVPQIIQKYEYPVETYTVPTVDGYVLAMHRIPRGRVPCTRIGAPRPVIFLMHGIFASSADFIINGPTASLGFLLADAGFDVWIGNARGNRYSRTHRSLVPANAAFWDFSFHEIGYYDLPAMIDFIVEMAGVPNMFYIGHSQGTTVLYILLATRPEYNDRIRAGFSLSPISFMTHMTSPLLRFFATFSNPIGLFFDMVGIGEFLPTSQLMSQLGQLICKGMDFTQFICTTPMFVLTGYNPSNLNKTRFPVYMGHLPAGASTRQVIHYGQLYLSGRFRQFDLGIVENMITFGAMYPPDYNLHVITIPNYLFYSPADWLGHPKDVDRLAQELPNPIRCPIKDPNFAHFDFMYGINAKEMVYDPLMEELKKLLN